jgi:hypothetical protein
VTTANDSATDTVEVNSTTQSNFSVAPLDLNTSSVDAGETVEVNATVNNTGEASGNQTVSFLVNGTDENTTDLQLDAGNSTTERFTYTTSEADVPNVTVNVTTANDSATDTVEVNSTTANYTIESVETNVSSVDANETIRLNYTVNNTGDGAGNQTIDFLANSSGRNDSNSNVTVNAGETFNDSFNYTTNSSDPPAVNLSVRTDNDINSTTVDVNATTGNVSVESPLSEANTTFNVTTSNIDWNTASGGHLNISDEQGNSTTKSDVGNNKIEINASKKNLNLTTGENITAKLYESSSEQNLLDEDATNVSS